MDLGGVDVAGARARAAAKASRCTGLYQHKQSFGGAVAGADRRPRARLRPARLPARPRWPSRVARAIDRPMTEPTDRRAARGRRADRSRPSSAGSIDAPDGRRAACAAHVATAGRSARPASAAIAVTRRHRRLARRPRRARCSWRYPGSTSTGTTSSPRQPRPVPSARSSSAPLPEVDLPQLVVDDARPALATAAAWWYGDPSAELAVVGITGTDGKTTTSFLATAALEAAGVRTGMIGTAATRIGGVQAANEAHATTPEAPELQRALRAMVVAGDAAAVIETTSHGLALDRVGAIAYDVAILTNLTHEHLELHGTWEAYRDAKLSLFERLAAAERRAPPSRSPGRPTGDRQRRRPLGRRVHRGRPGGGRAGPDLRHGPGGRRPRDPRRGGPAAPADRLRGAVRARPRSTSGWSGRFNVHNALAVVALGEAVGLDPAAVRDGPRLGPGRARADGADRGRPAVRGHRRLRAQPGVARRPCSTCSRRWPRRAAAD